MKSVGPRFWSACWLALAVLAGTVGALYLLLFGWGMALRIGWVSDRTRRLTKPMNRRLRNIAGTRLGRVYFNLGLLHHGGRRSGRPYETPLSAYPLGDGFVLAKAYPQVDWCDNVLAAGTCTLTWNGREHALDRPRLISRAEAMKAYPLLAKPFLATGAGQHGFLWLHRVDTGLTQPCRPRAQLPT